MSEGLTYTPYEATEPKKPRIEVRVNIKKEVKEKSKEEKIIKKIETKHKDEPSDKIKFSKEDFKLVEDLNYNFDTFEKIIKEKFSFFDHNKGQYTETEANYTDAKFKYILDNLSEMRSSDKFKKNLDSKLFLADLTENHEHKFNIEKNNYFNLEEAARNNPDMKLKFNEEQITEEKKKKHAEQVKNQQFDNYSERDKKDIRIFENYKDKKSVLQVYIPNKDSDYDKIDKDLDTQMNNTKKRLQEINERNTNSILPWVKNNNVNKQKQERDAIIEEQNQISKKMEESKRKREIDERSAETVNAIVYTLNMNPQLMPDIGEYVNIKTVKELQDLIAMKLKLIIEESKFSDEEQKKYDSLLSILRKTDSVGFRNAQYAMKAEQLIGNQ